MIYTDLSEEQFNEAYTYFIKVLVNTILDFQNAPISKKSEIRSKIQQLCIEFNKVRKANGAIPITTAKIHMGDASFYLEFF